MSYTVSKVYDSKNKQYWYYVHMVGFPNIPVMPSGDDRSGTFTEKYYAFKRAAYMNMRDSFSLPEGKIGIYNPKQRR